MLFKEWAKAIERYMGMKMEDAKKENEERTKQFLQRADDIMKEVIKKIKVVIYTYDIRGGGYDLYADRVVRPEFENMSFEEKVDRLNKHKKDSDEIENKIDSLYEQIERRKQDIIKMENRKGNNMKLSDDDIDIIIGRKNSKIQEEHKRISRLNEKKWDVYDDSDIEFCELSEQEIALFNVVYDLFMSFNNQYYSNIKNDEWEKIPIEKRKNLFRCLEECITERWNVGDMNCLYQKIFKPEEYRICRDAHLSASYILTLMKENNADVKVISKEKNSLEKIRKRLEKELLRIEKLEWDKIRKEDGIFLQSIEGKSQSEIQRIAEKDMINTLGKFVNQK